MRNFFLIALFALMLASGCDHDLQPQGPVLVHCPGDAASLRGTKPLLDTDGFGSADILVPHHMKIIAKDGTVLEFDCRSSSILFSHRHVMCVMSRRPVETPNFATVKADCLALLKRLKVPIDAPLKHDLATLPDQMPDKRPDSTFIPYTWKMGSRIDFHGLFVDLQISPDPNGGWYYLITFSPSVIQPAS